MMTNILDYPLMVNCEIKAYVGCPQDQWLFLTADLSEYPCVVPWVILGGLVPRWGLPIERA